MRLSPLLAGTMHTTDKSTKWTLEAIALLGTQSDAKIASLLGIGFSTAAVFNKRSALGITAKVGRGVWSDEIIALLGTMPDLAIAKKLGIGNSAVRQKRFRLGIAPFATPAAKVDLPASIARQIGKIPDVAVARLAGVSPSAISNIRKKKRIDPALTPRTFLPDEAIPLLGTMPDIQLADLYGTNSRLVGKYRTQRSIKPYVIVGPRPAKVPQEMWDKLGTMSDRALGLQCGLSREMINNHRRLSGIPAYRARRAGVQGDE
ncbi:hypothetical protein ACI77O_12270 [Pseudomonas tritici]|uniref:hypothetical protein n=1 Tax=Pseudomonas tritici TaxID=2745518 RepID=UPI00387A9D87